MATANSNFKSISENRARQKRDFKGYEVHLGNSLCKLITSMWSQIGAKNSWARFTSKRYNAFLLREKELNTFHLFKKIKLPRRLVGWLKVEGQLSTYGTWACRGVPSVGVFRIYPKSISWDLSPYFREFRRKPKAFK